MLPRMRWLLPWLSVLLVSSAIAYAADRGLEGVLRDIPTQAPLASPTTAPPEPGSVWVLVEVRSDDGAYNSFNCLADSSQVTTDVIQVRAPELRNLVTALCIEVMRS
jgi:hypothetical protein